MKKLLLLLVLCAGFTAEAQSQEEKGKVAYANMEYIISQLPQTKEIQTELEATQAELQKKIEDRQKELQKEYTDFNASMENMADTVQERKQRELEQSIADLQQMQQDAQRTLQNKHKLFMAPIYLQINRAIADVAKEGGFSVILNQEVGRYRLLLYHNEQRDISKLVLQKMGVTPKESK